MYSAILALLVLTSYQVVLTFTVGLKKFNPKVEYFKHCLDDYNAQCPTDKNVIVCKKQYYFISSNEILKNETCLDKVKYLVVDRLSTDIDKLPNLNFLDISDPILSKRKLAVIQNLKQLKGVFLSNLYVDPLSQEDKQNLLGNFGFIIYKYSNPFKSSKFVLKKCFDANAISISTHVYHPIPIFRKPNPFLVNLNAVTYFATCSDPKLWGVKRYRNSLEYLKIYDKKNCLIDNDLTELQHFTTLKFLEIDQTRSKNFNFLNVMRSSSQMITILYKIKGRIHTMVTNKCKSIEICSLITPGTFECNTFKVEDEDIPSTSISTLTTEMGSNSATINVGDSTGPSQEIVTTTLSESTASVESITTEGGLNSITTNAEVNLDPSPETISTSSLSSTGSVENMSSEAGLNSVTANPNSVEVTTEVTTEDNTEISGV